MPLPHSPEFFQFSDAGRITDALEGVGLRDIGVNPVDQRWRLDEPLGLIRAVLKVAVRARALLLAQTAQAREAIKRSIEERMSGYRAEDGTYAVPMPALVGAGSA